MKRTSVLSSLALGAGLALSGCASKGETPRVESAGKPSAVVADQAEVRTAVEAVD